jgi:hypothetical protein
MAVAGHATGIPWWAGYAVTAGADVAGGVSASAAGKALQRDIIRGGPLRTPAVERAGRTVGATLGQLFAGEQ